MRGAGTGKGSLNFEQFQNIQEEANLEMNLQGLIFLVFVYILCIFIIV